MHDCYEALSPAAMRTAVQFAGVGHVAPQYWRDRLRTAIEHGTHPRVLHNCGVTAPLLAYCGITLDVLVENAAAKRAHSFYPLEHLIEAFELTMTDLLLLGFKLSMLTRPALYPLIVLYDKCGLRADTVFKFHVSHADLQRSLFDVDPRYAVLLNLNVAWLQRALQCSE
jgi:hypothetical protein